MYEENSDLEQRRLSHEGPLARSKWNAVSFMYKGYEISIAGSRCSYDDIALYKNNDLIVNSGFPTVEMAINHINDL